MINEDELLKHLENMYDSSGPCIVCRKKKKILKFNKPNEFGPICSIKCRQKAVEALKQEHYGE